VKREIPLTILSAFILSPFAIQAQTQTASLSGIVTDSTGAVVPGAAVTIRNVDTGVARTAESNAAGYYVFTNLIPGRYRVSVVKEGFQAANTEVVTLDVGDAADLPIQLKVGDISQSVWVGAEAAELEVTKGQMGTVVTEEKIHELPLNGRNFTQLLALTPGSAPVSVGQNAGGAQVQRIGVIVFPAIDGQRNRSNSFTIDGVYNNGHFMGTYAIAPSVDALSQFKVQSQGDQAEFGAVTGGVVNTVTKSGTNSYHRVLYEFLRNDQLDARNFFAARRQPLRQNQFGVTLGGPIRRDKAFLFFSYEGYRQRNASDTLTVVPTRAERGGDFSGSSRAIYNPYTTRPDPAAPNRFLRDPFPGNRIPANLLNPSIQSWLSAIVPEPIDTGVPGFNMRNREPLSYPAGQYNVRVDHTISSADLVWVRFTWGHQDQVAPMQLPGTRVETDVPAKNFGFNYSHIFGSRGLLNALVGYSSLGLTDSRFLTDKRLLAEGQFRGMPFNAKVNAPGMTVPSLFGNLYAANRILGPMRGYQWRLDYSQVAGSHNWKTGIEMVRMPWRNAQLNPNFTFNAIQTANPNDAGRTGNDVASFLLGTPEAWQIIDQDYRLYSSVWSAFVQDTWRATTRFSLNFGLRWDGVPAPVVTRGAPGNWDLISGKYISAIPVPPACSASQPAPCLPNPSEDYLRQYVIFTGNPRLRKAEWGLLGPRFGAAYRLTSRTALRASFGILYDLLNAYTQPTQNTAQQWPSVALICQSALNRSGVDLLVSDPFQGKNPRIPAASPAAATSNFFDPNIRSPYSPQWSFEVQHQLYPATIFSVAYVGNRALRLQVSVPYNTAASPGPGAVTPRKPSVRAHQRLHARRRTKFVPQPASKIRAAAGSRVLLFGRIYLEQGAGRWLLGPAKRGRVQRSEPVRP